MTIKFYDTSSLLLKANNLFNEENKIAISSITLSELEKIKNASNKDPDIKYSARQILKELEEHYGEYIIIIFKEKYLNNFKDFEINNDIKFQLARMRYSRCVKIIILFLLLMI